MIELHLPEDELGRSLERALATHDIRQTARAGLDEFHLMGEAAYIVPPFRRYLTSASSYYVEEPSAMVALAVDWFLQGRLDRPTLVTVLKLNNVSRPGRFLMLSERDARVVGRVLTEKKRGEPIYRWQRRGACSYSLTGAGYYDVTNALGVVDTRRFLQFFAAAWKENPRVRYLPNDIFALRGVLPERKSSGKPPHFSEYQLNQELAKVLARVRQMTRPCVYKEMT